LIAATTKLNESEMNIPVLRKNYEQTSISRSQMQGTEPRIAAQGGKGTRVRRNGSFIAAIQFGV